MHIKSVDFAGAIGQVGQAPPGSVQGLPQIAFSGRSNVGKSSLINRFLGRTRSPIARVSQQPGKTQEINFYHVRSDHGDFCLVDLPGYGFARAPAPLRERWRELIDRFLRTSEALVGVVQLIDIRHGPTKDDQRAIEYIAASGLPVLFVLTKSDKLTATHRQKAVTEITDALGVEPGQVLPFSSLSGAGRDELLESVGSLLPEPAEAEEG